MREINAADALHWFKKLPYRSQLGTINPQYVWADSKRDEKNLKPLFLFYQEDHNFWLFSAHIMPVPGSEFRAISSPYGYGEPVTNTEDHQFVKRAWKRYERWAHEHLILCDIVKFHPLLKHPYLGEHKFDRWAYTVGTKPYPSCLNKIRKADKAHLTVVEGPKDDIHMKFAGQYHEAMDKLKAQDFYHFSDNYFQALSEIDDVLLSVCQDEDGDWLSASIMLAGGMALESHLTITNDAGRKVGATNFLVHEMKQKLHPNCAMYLGGGKTRAEDDSLAEFKKSFNGARLPFHIGWTIHRPSVYKEMKLGNTSDRVLFWQQ